MSGRRAIVIAVDGLRASALGPYGNTWHPTPAFDALASRAVVVEWMLRESPELEGFYKSAWGGDLPRGLAAAGGATALVTDDGKVAAWADAAGIADVWHLESPEPATAEEIGDTALARLFAVAAEQLGQLDRSADNCDQLLWVHAHGAYGPWDAPRALRSELLNDDEISAPEFVLAPRYQEIEDHDILLAYRAAYAAQTIVLDECLSALVATAESGREQETLVAVVGCRGFALGEHGAVGSECRKLYGELLHVPCLIAATQLAPAPPRWPNLATPADLGASLASWFGLAGREGPPLGVDLLAVDSRVRQHIVAVGVDGERALRTSEWYLRQPARGASVDRPGAELYVKPDDRWEANEIADRRRDVAEALTAALDRIAASPESSAFEPLPELPADVDQSASH